MISKALLAHLFEQFGTIKNIKSIGGGSINYANYFSTQSKEYFIKWNDKPGFDVVFEKEIVGLNALSNTGINTPEIITSINVANYTALVLEYIPVGPRTNKAMRLLGEDLAKIHLEKTNSYGLNTNNFMGSLLQVNDQNPDWRNFFITHRLQHQVKLGLTKGLITPAEANAFERLYQRLPQLLPQESPTLIHGDLWSGNYMINSEGQPYFIDPAVYYGHREVDLAMTYLFGGFSHDFYDAYQSTLPLSPGFTERIDIYNLYPLLIHLNLFGMGYHRQVMSIVNQYT